MKKILAMIAMTVALAACSATPVKPVDCSALQGTTAQSQCFSQISPQS